MKARVHSQIGFDPILVQQMVKSLYGISKGTVFIFSGFPFICNQAELLIKNNIFFPLSRICGNESATVCAVHSGIAAFEGCGARASGAERFPRAGSR
jgi:hypothetical protein